MGIFKKFSKKSIVEESKTPDLMAVDPIEGENVNLMAADPINNFQEIPVVEKTPEIIESPGIENQLMSEPVNSLEVPIAVTIDKTPEPMETTTSMNAFEMSMPSPEVNPSATETLEPELSSPVEPQPSNDNLTNKYCTDCGNPNDALNKFCVSCGMPFDSN